jgi:hypothetical protein
MQRRGLRSVVLMIAAIATLATGCGESGVETTAPDATAADTALTGTADTLAGGQIELTSLEGQDTVLWFWAPW